MRVGRSGLSPHEIVRRYHSAGDEQALNALVVSLRESPSAALVAFETLAESGEDEIRLWLTEVTPQVLGHDALPILRDLVRDRDSDVRIEALGAIVALDSDEAHKMAAMFRRRAGSNDLHEAQAALWALGAIRDVEALDVIRAAQLHDNAIPRNTAIAVELLLTAPSELCQRIEEHDHVLMPWLAKAAEILGTEAARQALESCALNAPDEECRFWANKMLNRFRPRGADHGGTERAQANN